MAEQPHDMTYTRCEHCNGSGELSDPNDENGMIYFRCRMCDGRGWMPTGLTLRQIDRMVERERALKGDPGIPEDKRRKLILALAERVAIQSELLSRKAERK